MNSMSKKSVISLVLGLAACLLAQSPMANAIIPLGVTLPTTPIGTELVQQYQPPGASTCKPGYVYRVIPNDAHQRSVASSGTCVLANCNTPASINPQTAQPQCKANITSVTVPIVPLQVIQFTP